MNDKPNKEGAPLGNRNRAKGLTNLKPVTIRLFDSQLIKLKAIALSQDTNYNELIRNWIDNLEAAG